MSAVFAAVRPALRAEITKPAPMLPGPVWRGSEAHAELLYPDNPALQAEWCRAVRVVRSTSTGWLLDNQVDRRA